MHWLVLGYVALLILRPQEFIPALQAVPLLFYWLLACLAGCMFGSRTFMQLPQSAYVIAFVIGATLTVGLSGWWGGVPEYGQMLVTSGSLFMLGAVAFRAASEVRRLCVLLLLCGVIIAIHGHFQKLDGVGWTGLPPIQGRITYSGIFSDPNDLGQLFIIAASASVFLYNTSGAGGKTLVMLACMMLGYGVILTDSRGALLAGMAVFLAALSRRYGRIVATSTIALALPALLLTTRLSTAMPGEESAQDRVNAWYAGIQMWLSNPAWGVGLGNFTDHNLLTAHNMLILPIAETGLLGFVPWFGFLILTFQASLRLWRQSEPGSPGASLDAAEAQASTAVALMVLGFAVTGFFLSKSYSPMLFLLGGVVAGRQLGVLEATGQLAVPAPKGVQAQARPAKPPVIKASLPKGAVATAGADGAAWTAHLSVVQVFAGAVATIAVLWAMTRALLMLGGG
jgi:hypothetical protein